MQEVRLNLYQADRGFQIEIGSGGFVFGYRLLGPKFDGSSRLIKSVILSDRDKEEILGFIKPDAKAIEDERDGYRNGQQQLQNTLSTVMDSNAKWANDYKKLKEENKRLREALERIAAYDSYHSEWPTEIWINAPPEELAHVILSGGKYPPQQTHVGGKL